MKIATKRVAAYELDCPDCGEGIPAPDTGSYLWPVNLTADHVTSCPACGIRLKIPGVVKQKAEA